MKLVTSFAALDVLGPGHTWRTTLATDGRIEGDALDGHLYLVGGADPFLTYDRLDQLLAQARQLGLRDIRGGIVLDHGLLHLPPHDPAAFDDRPLRPYNAGPDALLLNFNAIHIALLPNPGQTGPRALARPELPDVQLDNAVTTAPGPCGVWFRDLDAEVTGQTPERTQIRLTGTWRDACGPREWNLAPLPPRRFAAALVAAEWQALGGTLGAGVRDGSTPPDATELLSQESPSLADLLRDMNKWSNNVMAKEILAFLGQQASPDAPDHIRAGADAARASLLRAGIDTRGLVIDNGSGLSREARISATSLGQLLRAAWQQPWMPEFVSSLPLAGVDGTARRRLRDGPVSGRAHVKTGTLDGAKALAGYVLDAKGRTWCVVMIVNDPNAARAGPAQDALLEWLWQGKP